jgi:hypothetical protein
MLQHCYCFEDEDYDCLCEAYPNGLLLKEGQDYAEQIDEVIKQRSSSICSLVSLEKLLVQRRSTMVDIIILSDNLLEMELLRWTILSLLHMTSMVYRSITRWLELENITNTHLSL